MTLDDLKPSREITGYGVSVDNVNEALPLGLGLVFANGVPVCSRGLETLEVPGPVMTVYRNPTRRVLFDEVRDANPFFHLIESLWILAGDNGVALPRMFLDRIADFSDNGKTFHGAYGHRLRASFGFDQLTRVVTLLREKPDTRQAVLSIWDPRLDLGATTKDTPCNDLIMLRIQRGKLNMTVCCRSNDVVLGAYGANVVQFSMLLEWIAAMVGVEVGTYIQMSNSYHVYTDNPFWTAFKAGAHDSGHVHNPYMDPEVQPYPLANTPAEADQVAIDCFRMVTRANAGIHLFGNEYHENAGPDELGYASNFFVDVVVPIVDAYEKYKAKNYTKALETLTYCHAADWRLACSAWVLRRKEKHDAKVAAGGV